uniref:Thioredoxin domain-containing protein n=1 Tax=Gouania willdenowi TaxID=441366 RepID=A0A8C5N768_GOUWI
MCSNEVSIASFKEVFLSSSSNLLLNSKIIFSFKKLATQDFKVPILPPLFKCLAAENNDVVVAECDIDDETIESLKAKYNVQTIPHVALLKDGVVVETFAGYKPKAAMLELIDKYR